MKEVKFRGKKIDGSNCFVYGSLITDGEKYYIISKDNLQIGENNTIGNTSVQPVIPETVGQYTRFKDKNYKEIYFDDVVYIAGIGFIRIENIGDIVFLYEGSCRGDIGEIKGNIHENKDLFN